MAIKRTRPSPSQQPPSKKAKKSKSPPSLPDLPDDVIYNILARCPYKSICRFKAVSKNWHLKLAMSITRTKVAFDTNKGLVFLDDELRSSSIHLELGEKACVRAILASANGLLCLYCSEPNEKFLYVCNPAATREGDRIPLPPVYFIYGPDSIGLVFDPIKSPHRYTLVHPMQEKPEGGGVAGSWHQFMVFSSDRREWVKSGQVVGMEHVTMPWRAKNPVLANGVLYWSCTDYLLYFDYDNKQAGYISLPEELPRFAGQEIGVCEGRVTYTRLYEKLEVWMLDRSQGGGGGEWEKLYQGSLEALPPAMVQTMRLTRGKTVSKDLVTRYQVTPLPFEGGDGSVLFRLIARRKTRYHQEKSTLRYDINTGKLDEVFNGDQPLLFQDDQRVFGYCSTMLPLPK